MERSSQSCLGFFSMIVEQICSDAYREYDNSEINRSLFSMVILKGLIISWFIEFAKLRVRRTPSVFHKGRQTKKLFFFSVFGSFLFSESIGTEVVMSNKIFEFVQPSVFFLFCRTITFMKRSRSEVFIEFHLHFLRCYLNVEIKEIVLNTTYQMSLLIL